MPDSPDFFATLLLILSMQVMLRLDARVGTVWIGLCAVMVTLILLNPYGSQAIALSLVYTAGSVLLGFFTLATRRAHDALIKADALARQLQEANDKLKSYSLQLKELSASREKNRLARDLHDSVTQTAFSMSLTAQSAGLLLDRDHNRLRTQLEHLSQLSRSALAELNLLVSELHPSGAIEGGLISTLQKHIASRRFPDNLSISLQVEGAGTLSIEEEQGLFRIIQEALNNIVKHAQTTQAGIQLHFNKPYWIEIVDHGKGFDLHNALAGSIGLNSMYERAAEIGWTLQIDTSPREGTRIRLENK
jgi:signal transduction histidine kinase